MMKLNENVKILRESQIQIEKSYGFTDSQGLYNRNVVLQGIPGIFRTRSEILIFNGCRVYLGLKNGSFKIPGGGWEKNEDPVKSAVREAQEEARLNVKNPKYILSYYHYESPGEWAQKIFEKDQLWDGKFTRLYIGEYESLYKGPIAKQDRDDLVIFGEFHPIDDVYDILPSAHQRAISYYYGILGKRRKLEGGIGKDFIKESGYNASDIY